LEVLGWLVLVRALNLALGAGLRLVVGHLLDALLVSHRANGLLLDLQWGDVAV